MFRPGVSRLALAPALAVALLALVASLPISCLAQPGKPRVVATFSVLGHLVEQIGGDVVEVRTLVGPGGDVHTFEPSPADSANFAGALLIVENGVGLEPWLDRLYSASRSRAERLAVADGLPLLKLGGEEDDKAGQAGPHGHDHASGEFDPHVWQDPARVILVVAAIRDALSTADPANAATYTANAARYTTELEQLDAWAVSQVALVPAERKKLVTNHEAFAYFADRYGFQVVGTALPLSTEASDPSAGEIAELVEKIKAAGVPVIFAENASNPRLMRQIAGAAGVQVATLYDVLGEPGTPGATYVSMVQYNVSTIVSGLTR